MSIDERIEYLTFCLMNKIEEKISDVEYMRLEENLKNAIKEGLEENKSTLRGF